MHWSPSFERLLEAQPAEQLQAHLLWLLQSGDEPLNTRSPALRHAMETVHTMTPPECLSRLQRLSAQDIVRMTLLQEFGVDFARKPGFQALARLVAQRAAL